jgi:hypothetical protein
MKHVVCGKGGAVMGYNEVIRTSKPDTALGKEESQQDSADPTAMAPDGEGAEGEDGRGGDGAGCIGDWRYETNKKRS